ncbi:hypothetical protein [Alteribacillus bidgolensis]|uniref:Uncharacterized protein n=1 Tax=Alteribacillus bidgolensis TaxID=930129 RepID=A0A1G8JEV0_9BACI|nr:hypothetical protein [Alteribacillus bidgolensis]SDI29593.1 hypothetical protein SAMN05216352_106166 [Alteribacillus bidgolensis]
MAHRENKNRQDQKNRELNNANRKRNQNHQRELHMDNMNTEFACESEFQDDLDNLNNRGNREEDCIDC